MYLYIGHFVTLCLGIQLSISSLTEKPRVVNLLCEAKAADARVWVCLVRLLLNPQNVLLQSLNILYTSLSFVECDFIFTENKSDQDVWFIHIYFENLGIGTEIRCVRAGSRLVHTGSR
jgi:hypothetical protein